METLNDSKDGHSPNGRWFVFDEFEIDASNRTCVRNGVEVPLTARVFDILLVFAENPGRLLEKDELIEKVWRGDFVEDGNLTRNVSTLRKALGDTGREHKYINTVQGHGYKFVADVGERKNGSRSAELPKAEAPTEVQEVPAITVPARVSRNWLWAIPAVLLLSAFWIGKDGLFPAAPRIRSLAVLPLKSLDANEDYIGVGIADAVIRRLSQAGQLTVRPTSAVIRFRNTDTDALAAARQLTTDAVLEGTVQHSGDRLRVGLDLLRTSDGVSLWADSFDMRAADIFTIQDTIAQQVATRLRLQFDATQQAKQYTSSPAAYNFYAKGIYELDQRGYGHDAKPQIEQTIDLFKKAIEVDPNYALAHAQLAYTYTWAALFVDQDDPKWSALANDEIKRSQELDPKVAESHQAKALLLWSANEGFQNEAAVRELILAQEINPGTGHADLAAIYGHMGLEDLASRELQRAQDVDPTSETVGELAGILPYLAAKPDEYLAAFQKRDPKSSVDGDSWYLLRKGRLNEAEARTDKFIENHPDSPDGWAEKALVLALKSDFSGSEAVIPVLISKLKPVDHSFHHFTYDIACVYAMMGKSEESVHWLQTTAASGFPNYPLFERDPYLDRVRQTPEFTKFMSEQKAQWERFQQEFGS